MDANGLPAGEHGERLSVLDARRRVEALDRRQCPGGGTVIVDRGTDVAEDCIVFHVNTLAFALDPDTDDVLIGAPRYLVDRWTGAVYVLPSAGPVESWIERFRSGGLEGVPRLTS